MSHKCTCAENSRWNSNLHNNNRRKAHFREKFECTRMRERPCWGQQLRVCRRVSLRLKFWRSRNDVIREKSLSCVSKSAQYSLLNSPASSTKCTLQYSFATHTVFPFHTRNFIKFYIIMEVANRRINIIFLYLNCLLLFLVYCAWCFT